jgi:CheY-like chemotaxis protein
MAESTFPYPGKSILLVEDNIDNQYLMVDMMEYIGCKVDIASDGEEGVQKWEKNSYDLIIMDVHMPKMNGYQASLRIRKLENGTRHIPILALTASALTSDRDQCFDAGMDDYLSKPINIDMLEAKLAEIFKKFQYT